jgi:hypothetical protein
MHAPFVGLNGPVGWWSSTRVALRLVAAPLLSRAIEVAVTRRVQR